MMQPVRILLSCCVALISAGCSPLSVLNAITPAGGYSEVKSIIYTSDNLGLDVYIPEHARAAPVIVFLYGGSWQARTTYTKQDYRFVGQALAARGFVTIIPDYRLYPAVRYPAFLDDCAKAVVWAHAHASAYGGNAERLAVMGHSAGAYNAAMLALDPSYLQRAGGERSWLKAMIGLAGPYDFLPLEDRDLEQIFATAVPLESSQPINHVDGHNPPMLLMAGENDDIVYVKNTNNLYERIRSRGGIVEKTVYPKMGHFKIILRTASRLQGSSDVMSRITDFMQRYVGVPADVAR